jgi:hypothetical protein
MATSSHQRYQHLMLFASCVCVNQGGAFVQKKQKNGGALVSHNFAFSLYRLFQEFLI